MKWIDYLVNIPRVSKNYENWPTFAEVIIKICGTNFLRHGVIHYLLVSATYKRTSSGHSLKLFVPDARVIVESISLLFM